MKDGERMINDKLIRQSRKGMTSFLRLLFLIAFSFILLYPVVFMVANAVKVSSDTLNPSVDLFSRAPTLYGFKAAFVSMNFWETLKNTVFFSLIAGMIEVFTCSVYAYGLSRFRFRFKGVLMALLIFTILVPDVMLIIPRVTNFRYMDLFGILGGIKQLTGVDLRPNLTDTVWTFYLPSLFGVGLKGSIFIFIYMQFFKGLPKELEEAAWIDGAGPVKTYLRIIVPSAGVAFLTVFLLSFVWHWNDWLLPSMYTTDNYTLSYALKNINDMITFATVKGEILNDPNLVYGAPLAACLLFIVPPLALYLVLQKQFIQSIDRVGIVG